LPSTAEHPDDTDRHVALWSPELSWLNPLHEEIVGRLTSVTKHLDRARAEAHRDSALSRASFRVLMGLRRLGAPYTAQPSQLAEYLGLSRGALSVRLGPLEDRGLIVRAVDSDDRRKVHVTLTRAGHRAFDRHGEREGRGEAAVFDTLSTTDQRQLADLLRFLTLAFEGRAP
jgi:DNA-binding MarR family transcriptional regulator